MRRGYLRIYRILDSSNLKKTAKAEFRVEEINGTKETHLYEWFIIRIRTKQKPNKKSGSFLSFCSWPVQVNMDLGGTWAQLRCLWVVPVPLPPAAAPEVLPALCINSSVRGILKWVQLGPFCSLQRIHPLCRAQSRGPSSAHSCKPAASK